MEMEGLSKIIKDIVRHELEELSVIQPTSKTTPEWFTREQVAEYFKVSLGTVDNLSRNGVLKKHYVGRSPRFKKDEILQALDSYQKFQSLNRYRKAG